ncbi:hypothetical protein SSAG_00814 [Streptomyces sp. Mg1]|nr:hypothetical protein SSAG_00814 [Streptomyces sp. Mg1]
MSRRSFGVLGPGGDQGFEEAGGFYRRGPGYRPLRRRRRPRHLHPLLGPDFLARILRRLPDCYALLFGQAELRRP